MDCLHDVMFGSLLIIVFPAVQGVTACEWGKYGHNCDRLCSDQCGLHPGRNLRPCDKDTGKCFEGCARGRHGDHCDQLCSPNCIKNSCIQLNGECTIGCMEGYSGYFCNITTVTTTFRPCDWGRFGETCDQACPSGCALGSDRNTTYCQTDTGTCTRGCRRGWHGDRCEKLCGRNCIADTCHQGSGHCTHGCRGRYTGEFCEAEKGERHITLGMQLMSMLLVIFILSTICCWKSPRCRRTCHKGFRWLIRRIPSAPSSDPSQNLSRSESVPLVPLTTQESDHHALSNLSQDQSQSDRDSLISTASHATPSPADLDLYIASRVGDLEKVRRLLSTPGVDVNCRRGGWRRTPVMEAAHMGHRDVVELLVSEGADVSLVDIVGDNTLHYVCMRGDVEMVKYVLSLNVDINSRGGGSRTPVMAATERRHSEVAEVLVNKGADVSLVDKYGHNTLHFACRVGDVEMVKFVLSLNVVDIDARNMWGETAADWARLMGRQQVVELLKSRGSQ